jgi:hypothetical protein
MEDGNLVYIWQIGKSKDLVYICVVDCILFYALRDGHLFNFMLKPNIKELLDYQV